jgi:hypothetical protein
VVGKVPADKQALVSKRIETSQSADFRRGSLLEVQIANSKIEGSNDQKKFHMDFAICNVGRSDTIVDEVKIGHLIADELPAKSESVMKSVSMNFRAHAGGTFRFETTTPSRIKDRLFLKILKGSMKYFVYGVVEYRDDSGDKKSTGFIFQVYALNVGSNSYRFALGPAQCSDDVHGNYAYLHALIRRKLS